MDARGRATIEARGAPVPTTFTVLRVGGARDARGPGMTDTRGFVSVVVVEVAGLAAMEGRGRRFAEPPTPALLGLVGVEVSFEGDFGVPCAPPPTRLLGEPLRVTPDLLLLIEEMLDVDVVRT